MFNGYIHFAAKDLFLAFVWTEALILNIKKKIPKGVSPIQRENITTQTFLDFSLYIAYDCVVQRFFADLIKRILLFPDNPAKDVVL